MTIAFFFHRYGHLRDLHSFPTRRSSDLGTDSEHKKTKALLCQEYVLRSDRVVYRIRSQHVLDRKSTRLNSSHRTISYAVFCLKKKKKSSSARTHTRAKWRTRRRTAAHSR